MSYKLWLRQLHEEVVVPDSDWIELEAEAAEKDRRSEGAEWTRRWGADFNLKGLVGEWLYARLTGLPRHKGFGDGGRDFPPGVDVKASAHYDNPLLLRLATDRFRAPYYGLVAVDLKSRRARYLGWTSREEFQSAPVAEYGYGLTCTLTPAGLRPGVPFESPYFGQMMLNGEIVHPIYEVAWTAERGRRLRLDLPLGMFA